MSLDPEFHVVIDRVCAAEIAASQASTNTVEIVETLRRCDRLISHLLDMHGPSGITGRPESEDDPTLATVRALIVKLEAQS